MNQPFWRRSETLWGLIVLGLVLATMICAGLLAAGRRSAQTAADDLAVCRDLAQRIQRWQSRPALASDQELRLADLTSRIEQAAEAAGIPKPSLVRISPESARAVGQTPFLEKPTQVSLRYLSLRQLITFLEKLTGEPGGKSGGLEVRSLRLSAPRGQETGSTWAVETTLSYWVYAPHTPR